MSSTKYSVKAPREIEVTLGKGVKGTIAIPHSADAENPYEEGLAPATHKAALILHGQGGHRDYCYQKYLAHKLAAELGVYSLRIDFRGCGSSADNEDPVKGRVLEQDIADIQAAAEFLIDGNVNGLGINLTLSSIVGHSRGGVAMFLWALLQDDHSKRGDPKAIIVPNLVNCSSRFSSPTVADRYPIFDDTFESIPQTSLRYGKLAQTPITRQELVSLAKPNLRELRHLTLDWSVLSVYGLKDTIIPISDSALYSNTLNRGHLSHRLELIPLADHNFYGTRPQEKDEDDETFNKYQLPVNNKGLVSYNYQATEIILDYLKPENELQRFLQSSRDIGRLSRWKNIEGVSNFRDIGGWKIHNPTFELTPKDPTDGASLQYYVKPHTAFRCANIAGITVNGAKTLQSLGIKAVFDLRSDGECEQDGLPKYLEDYGIKRIHAPVFSKDDHSPMAIALRYTNLLTSWDTYVNVYENMLEFGQDSYRTVFQYILEENKPFVFHCTAGKDRTGVLGMLILLLLGVDKNTIAREYELTTFGLIPDHPNIRLKFADTIKKLREKMGEGSDMEQMVTKGRKNWTLEEDGFYNLISSRYEAMLATIELFNDKYGSIINYLKEELGFSQEDIIKIYENLVVLDPQSIGFEVASSLNWDHRDAGRVKL
ncbi:protein-tyrosine phosphatase-like protein [Scheffersomyces coipomensis]|uniref:protein-tyrosine phosphatase-like protein n=1 Tax=Scheffersomyces coipomensis TaxID=1788519 RepID=UPI00315C9382